MEELYVGMDLRASTEQMPRYLNSIYTRQFSPAKPLKAKDSNEWLYYNTRRDGTPPPVHLALPAEMKLVCKSSVKGFEQDYFCDLKSDAELWIVSLPFYQMIKKRNLLEGMYEESELEIISEKGERICGKEHRLLRFHSTHDALIDFQSSPKITPGSKGRAGLPSDYYLDLNLKKGGVRPEMMVLTEACFFGTFLVNWELKEYIEQQQFQGIEFHALDGFVQECLYREKNIPW